MELTEPVSLSLLPLVFVVATAFFAGFLNSVAGGGGLITLPAMLLVGLPPHFALGTGKFMSCLGTAAAFISYARQKVIVWPIAAIGVSFAFAGSLAGAKTALLVDSSVLGKIILFLLPVAALLTFLPVRQGSLGKKPGRIALYVLTPLSCIAIGFYDGFFGPGAGSFLLLSLHLVIGLNLISASATAKTFNLASNISSLIVFLCNGKILYTVGIPMALANIAGNVLGSHLAIRKGPKLIRRMLLTSLTLLFASLIWRYYI